MKKITILLSIVLIAQFGLAQPPAGKATPGTVYGAVLDDKNVVPSSELLAMLKEKDTIQVKVKAKVQEVCSKKGCWLTFNVNSTEEAFVKMRDYAFFVPLDLIGKTVILEGKAYQKITSIAELKHYASDAKKSQKEVDAITEDKKEIRFMANGILVVE